MNILVTGGSGFIGKELVMHLESKGHRIFMYSQEDGDITKKGVLKKYLGENIGCVFHLAARTFVPASWEATYDYFNTNVMGTVEALEFCRMQKCPIILMSTYVYGEPQFLPVTEEHRIMAATPYHETKIVDEKIGEFYSKQFDFPVTIFRPFNVYGYGQNVEFLLPKIMKQVLDDNVSKVEVMDLTPKRDYVYIKDVVRALGSALQIKKGFNIYNIGYGKSYNVEEVIKICMDATGKKKEYTSSNDIRQNEISDCVADITKIEKDLGYEPRYDLYEGIKDWYEEIQAREK